MILYFSGTGNSRYAAKKLQRFAMTRLFQSINA